MPKNPLANIDPSILKIITTKAEIESDFSYTNASNSITALFS